MSTSVFTRRSFIGRRVSSRPLFRVCLAALLFLMLPVAADAYTLVLRSGRHVTVPDDFKVTPAAVVYEASPGFSVTVWLSSIDFAATERVNSEPAGSFVRRIKQEPAGATARARAPQTAQTAQTARRAGRRVVTNRELEPARLRREAQEEEYERTRGERGMPSKEELRLRLEEHDRRLDELARQMEAEQREAELRELRAELAGVRRQLGELSIQQQAAGYNPAYALPNYYPYFYGPALQVIPALPFGHLGHRGRFGRGDFGLRLNFGKWPHQRLPGHHSPIYVSPSRNAGFRPPVVRAPGHRR